MGEDVQDRVWEMVESEIEKIVDANIGDGRDMERYDDRIHEAYVGSDPDDERHARRHRGAGRAMTWSTS